MKRMHTPTHLPPVLVGLAMVAGLGTASPVQAQQLLVSRTPNIDYRSLSSNATVLTTDSDDGVFLVTSPFPIRFFGGWYTTFTVGANGALVFPSAETISFENAEPGDPRPPNNFIAPLWNDLRIFPTGALAFEVTGTAPNRRLAVEWRNVTVPGCLSCDSSSFQVIFNEDPAGINIDVEYGTLEPNFGATLGMEDESGVRFAEFSEPPCGSGCDGNAVLSVANTRVSIRPGPAPDLTGSVRLPPGAFAGAAVSATVALTNLGTRTATDTQSELWLSIDDAFDPLADLRLWKTVDDLPFGDTVKTATVTVPDLPSDDYFVFLATDVTDGWSEASELDNVVPAPRPFATGPDLTVGSVRVTNPVGVASGDRIDYEIVIVQDGAPVTRMVDIEVRASADTTLDPTDDPVVLAQTVMLQRQENQTVTLSGPLIQLPVGQYYTWASIDVTDDVVEIDETNNDTISAEVVSTGPDIRAASFDAPSGIAPGDTGTFVTRIESPGTAYTGPLEYSIYASTDELLVPSSDTVLGSFTLNLNGQVELVDSRQVVFPGSLGPGRYFIFVVVDSNNGIEEVDEANNQRLAPNPLTNAFDFTVSDVSHSPAFVEIGDVITVSAVIENRGLSFTGNVPVAVFLSEDDTLDIGDQALFRGFVFFPGTPALGERTFTFAVSALPGEVQFAPRTYDLFFIIDPDNLYPELQESNAVLSHPANLTIDAADLRVDELVTQSPVFWGRDLPVRVTIVNDDGATARGFRYAYYLSDNETIRFTDEQVYVSETATIAPGASQTFEDTVTLPVRASSASLFLGVIVDLFSQVPESSETNNARTATVETADGMSGVLPIELLAPAPDLDIRIVEAPSFAAAGEDIAVTRVLSNTGITDSGTFTYTYYLSANPTISPLDDIPIYTVAATVPAEAEDVGIDTFPLPSDLEGATYYIGAIADPGNQVPEVDEDNNGFTGPQVSVSPASIAFRTSSLPDGLLGVDYDAGLFVTGAPSAPIFEVTTGSLPDGLQLGATTGRITGRPNQEGIFIFTVQVSAAIPGSTRFASTEREFVLRITSPTVELSVATTVLPAAYVGLDYSVPLAAVGGLGAYSWTAVTPLPPSLTISEGGLLSGVPDAAGGFTLQLRVTDAGGNEATRDLQLSIIRGDLAVRIRQEVLFPGTLGTDYCPPTVALTAQNGILPYTWSTVGAPPPGMTLSPDGAFCGNPTRAGRFQFVARVHDASGTFDTSQFTFVVDEVVDLVISTDSLPTGEINAAYAGATLVARGMAPYAWSTVPDAGALPPGMALDADGNISGTPTGSGLFAFLVQVTDARQQTVTKPLSILVNAGDEGSGGGSDGCSCAVSPDRVPPWTPLALVIVIGLFLGLRRPGSRSALFVLLSGVGVAGSAEAQPVPGTPYRLERANISYATLPSCTRVTNDSDDGQFVVPLPFDVRYFRSDETSVTVSANGALTFGGDAISVNNAALGPGLPDATIAPWWDDLWIDPSNNADLCYTTAGSPPSRRFIIEWKNVSRANQTSGLFSMKVVLYESPSGRVDIEYSDLLGTTTSFSATSGMDSASGDQVVFFPPRGDCRTTCGITDFDGLASTRVSMILIPDLEAVSIAGPEFAFVGVQRTIPVQVRSLNVSRAIGPFNVRVEASTSATFASPVTVGESGPTTVQGLTVSSLNIPIRLPASLGTTDIYLRATVDADGAVAEANEDNNVVAGPGPVRLLPGGPDVAIEFVSPSRATVEAGQGLSVQARVTNFSETPTGDFTVRIALSSNAVISRQDVDLANFTLNLGPDESATTTTEVTIPAGTRSGAYYLGVLADPEDALLETSKINNGLASDDRVTVTGDALAITTMDVPPAYLATDYSALLQAAGSGENALWSIVSGRLPEGLMLTADTGEIRGRATMAETQTFTARVVSNGNQATQPLTIEVRDPAEPLTIATGVLASGVVGQEYSFALAAAGGAPAAPLSWGATNLPEGLLVTPDGLVMGTPTTAGQMTVALSVSDGVTTVSGDASLSIIENQNLLIAPVSPAIATFETPYNEQLQASGGRPPYAWLLASGALPQGLILNSNGVISGTPVQVGEFNFTVRVRDSGLGVGMAEDQSRLVIVVLDAPGFDINTTSLDPGFLNFSYEQAIAAAGGQAPYTWTREVGQLPAGLIDDVNPNTQEYRIRGEPTEAGITNLLIRVRDANGRVAERAFALQILDERPDESPGGSSGNGCACITPSTVPPPILLLLGAAWGLMILLGRRRVV